MAVCSMSRKSGNRRPETPKTTVSQGGPSTTENFADRVQPYTPGTVRSEGATPRRWRSGRRRKYRDAELPVERRRGPEVDFRARSGPDFRGQGAQWQPPAG